MQPGKSCKSRVRLKKLHNATKENMIKPTLSRASGLAICGLKKRVFFATADAFLCAIIRVVVQKQGSLYFGAIHIVGR